MGILLGAVIEAFQKDLFGHNDAELWDEEAWNSYLADHSKFVGENKLRADCIEFQAPPGGLVVTSFYFFLFLWIDLLLLNET